MPAFPLRGPLSYKEEQEMSNQPYSPDPRMQNYQEPPNQIPINETVSSSSSNGANIQSQHESYIDPMGNQVEKRAEVFEDENQCRANIRYSVERITYFV